MLGTVENPEFLLFRKIRVRAGLIVALISAGLRLLGATLRVRFEDRAGFCSEERAGVLVVFWHDQMAAMPRVFRLFYNQQRPGLLVLTSASGEGTILARILERFGVGAIRGSSSRQGTAAAMAILEKLRAGYDVAITPDGPRGPRHRLGCGMIQLAKKAGARILPVRVRYRRAVCLPTWDRFQIPLPFSTVEVVACDWFEVSQADDPAAMDQDRARLEEILCREG